MKNYVTETKVMNKLIRFYISVFTLFKIWLLSS